MTLSKSIMSLALLGRFAHSAQDSPCNDSSSDGEHDSRAKVDLNDIDKDELVWASLRFDQSEEIIWFPAYHYGDTMMSGSDGLVRCGYLLVDLIPDPSTGEYKKWEFEEEEAVLSPLLEVIETDKDGTLEIENVIIEERGVVVKFPGVSRLYTFYDLFPKRHGEWKRINLQHRMYGASTLAEPEDNNSPSLRTSQTGSTNSDTAVYMPGKPRRERSVKRPPLSQERKGNIAMAAQICERQVELWLGSSESKFCCDPRKKAFVERTVTQMMMKFDQDKEMPQFLGEVAESLKELNAIDDTKVACEHCGNGVGSRAAVLTRRLLQL